MAGHEVEDEGCDAEPLLGNRRTTAGLAGQDIHESQWRGDFLGLVLWDIGGGIIAPGGPLVAVICRSGGSVRRFLEIFPASQSSEAFVS